MNTRSQAWSLDMFGASIKGAARPDEVEEQPQPPHAYDYWKDYTTPRVEKPCPWLSPEDQHQALLSALDGLAACPCCSAPLSRKQWADGRFVRGPNFRGFEDVFRWRNDVLSVKFECGLFLAVEENVCLDAHHPCLSATGEAVQALFAAAIPPASMDGGV